MNELHYIELAHRLNQEQHARLLKVQAHFRGNRNSLSLISLRKDTPQLGPPPVKTARTALERLKVWEQKLPVPPKRVTREKEVQAWCILDALRNNGALPFDRRLRFLTSELVRYQGTQKHVNDILALDADGGLVVIELKSTRSKAQIEAQVETFMAIIQNDPVFFGGLCRSLADREWNQKVTGMVVWNASGMGVRKIKAGIREICFTDAERDHGRVIVYGADGCIPFEELF